MFYQIREKLLFENGLIAEQASVKMLHQEKKFITRLEKRFLSEMAISALRGSQRNSSVDHIYPESLGGTLELSNLQTLSASPCNSRKGKSSLMSIIRNKQ